MLRWIKKGGMHCETRSACRPPQGICVPFGAVRPCAQRRAHRRRPHPRLFRRRRTVFVELSHRPFHVPLRLCFPHHGRRDGKGQPSALCRQQSDRPRRAVCAVFRFVYRRQRSHPRRQQRRRALRHAAHRGCPHRTILVHLCAFLAVFAVGGAVAVFVL